MGLRFIFTWTIIDSNGTKLLVENEKKIVMYQRVITQAKKAVKEVDCSEAIEENDFNLVYTAGKAHNSA